MKITLEELKTKINEGEIDTIVIGSVDMFGQLIGKRATGRYFLENARNKMGMSYSHLAMTVDEMTNWMQKEPRNCLICGKFSQFKFYNVRSCNGCKQFFLRIVQNQIQYFCRFDGKCDLTKVKCRGCRLDRCLRYGMNPTSVHTENITEQTNRMFNSLETRQKELMMDESKKLNGLENYRFTISQELERESNQIEYLTKILNAHRQIADRCLDLPDSYLNKFRNIDEIFNGQENILSLADSFSPFIIDRLFIDEIAQLQREWIEIGFGEMHPKIRKIHIVYHLSAVGFLKAMPIFSQLTMKDKEILVRELGHQMNNLTNAYYSMEKGQCSVTGPKGLSTINVFIEIFKDFPRLIHMSKMVLVHPIETFRRIPMLSNEEFALLIAIHFSNPAITGLSSHARELLYREQCHYSQLLIKHCQQQTGNGAKGAQRYAECLQLIQCAFQAVHYFESISTYNEMFLARRHWLDDIPNEYVIKSLIK